MNPIGGLPVPTRLGDLDSTDGVRGLTPSYALVTTIPRERIKPGTLAAILEQMSIGEDELANLL